MHGGWSVLWPRRIGWPIRIAGEAGRHGRAGRWTGYRWGIQREGIGDEQIRMVMGRRTCADVCLWSIDRVVATVCIGGLQMSASTEKATLCCFLFGGAMFVLGMTMMLGLPGFFISWGATTAIFGMFGRAIL